MIAIEANDEWLVGRAYLSAESLAEVLALPDKHSQVERTREALLTRTAKEVAKLQPA